MFSLLPYTESILKSPAGQIIYCHISIKSPYNQISLAPKQSVVKVGAKSILSALFYCHFYKIKSPSYSTGSDFVAERGGFEPPCRYSPATWFPIMHLKPLGHLSISLWRFSIRFYISRWLTYLLYGLHNSMSREFSIPACIKLLCNNTYVTKK